MQASLPLTSGAADAVSIGSSYGRGSFPPVTRATITSDMVASPETNGGTWIYDQRLPTNDFQLTNWQGMQMATSPLNKAAAVASLPAPDLGRAGGAAAGGADDPVFRQLWPYRRLGQVPDRSMLLRRRASRDRAIGNRLTFPFLSTKFDFPGTDA